jgi:hypothetical protein
MNVSVAVLVGVVVGVGTLTIVTAVRDSVVIATRRVRRPITRAPRDERVLVESMAVWIEQLRDTMAGARGLEQAIVATAETAPSPIRPSVVRLADRLVHDTLSAAAIDFAEEIDNSLADFVVAVLVTASEQQVRDVGSVLSHLAECCRDEVKMRTRVWVSRARTRSAVRIIGAVVVVFVSGLFVLNRAYLEPYGSAVGVLVLAFVIALFAGALTAMSRLSHFETPPRFMAARPGGRS